MNFQNLAARYGFVAACLASPAALSQQAPSSSVPSAVSVSGVFQVLLGLIVVLGVIGATVWLLKKLSIGQQVVGSAVKVVGGVAVGPRERVVVVEVGGTWLLVGVAPGQVNALHSMPKPADLPETTKVEEPVFAKWLTQALHKRA